MIFRRHRSLPCGVEIGAAEISLVGIEMTSAGPLVKVTFSEALPATSDEERVPTTIGILRRFVAELPGKTRECILGAPVEDVHTCAFRVPPRIRASEAERAALLEAEALVSWPSHERLVAIDPIPGSDDNLLLCVARLDAIERLITIARAAGLDPVAIDVPLCAWRRAIRDAEAVIDLRRERAALFVFGKPLGRSDILGPRVSDDRLAALIRAALIQARRDGVADVARIVTVGSRSRCAPIEAMLEGDGYTIGPLVVGEQESPPWVYAYALASWSIVSQVQAA